MDYQTTYFDTPDNAMYLKHHNGKMNRHKIRQRKYVSTNSSFLEVKYKTNKKVTIKNRIETESQKHSFLESEISFIRKETPYSGPDLVFVLNNKFKRLTLIHREKLDRCTIDISPQFWNENNLVNINDLTHF